MKHHFRYLISAGIWGPIFYFLLLTFLGFQWPGYNPISTGMSELGAVDSPVKDVMNALGFSFLGVTMLMFSIGFFKFINEKRQAIPSFLLLAIGSIAMIAVGFLPCDSQCIDVTTTGQLHSLTSTIAAISTSFGVMIAAWPLTKKWSKQWGSLSFTLGSLSMASGPIMLSGMFDTIGGLVQRIGIGLSLLWIVLVSIKITKEIKHSHY